MQFILSDDWQSGISALSDRLNTELVNHRVLWLLSGGSNVNASVKIAANISKELTSNLTVMLIDERFGKVGHTDSNWTKLLEAGFKMDGAKMIPVLEQGLDFKTTTEKYNKQIVSEFSSNSLVIAQLGMGDDGHIAGILPNSSAANDKITLVTGYESDPYQRITLTFPALRKINIAYAFAFGESKIKALNSLRDESLPLAIQPAQILKEIPESYVYNDQLGQYDD